MLRLVCLMWLVASGAAAQEFTPMTGAEIEAALNDRKLDYGTATQKFAADGETWYYADRPSKGYWRVQGDQYCSEWPPAGGWTCYDLARAGNVLRFIGARGHITDGTYIE